MDIKNKLNQLWINDAPAKGSFRSIFKYGDPNEFKHPNERLISELIDKFNLTEKDFEHKETTGNELVEIDVKSKLSSNQVERFIEICGSENVSSKEYDRLKFSTGKTTEEAMKLRRGDVS